MLQKNQNGWHFVKPGKTYQYKEGSLIAMVTIIEDRSNSELYCFRVQIEQSNTLPASPDGLAEISCAKDFDDYYNGMPQLFETPMHFFEPVWDRQKNKPS